MKNDTITLTRVEGPPPSGAGRPLGDGHVRELYMRTALALAETPGWFSLGFFNKNKLDYLRKIMRSQGVQVTTRAVHGTDDFHVYAQYTGKITVPRRRRARR